MKVSRSPDVERAFIPEQGTDGVPEGAGSASPLAPDTRRGDDPRPPCYRIAERDPDGARDDSSPAPETYARVLWYSEVPARTPLRNRRLPLPIRCPMSIVQDALRWIEPAVATYGAFALFVTIYFESFGVPLPGESSLIAAALLAARGDLAIGHVFLAAWLGGVLGDSTGYVIGRFGGRLLLQRFGGTFGVKPERLSGWEQTARKRGFVLVLTARFVVVLRQLNGLLAGSVNMPWPKFALANVLGAALWSGVWTFAPYLFTDLFHRAL